MSAKSPSRSTLKKLRNSMATIQASDDARLAEFGAPTPRRRDADRDLLDQGDAELKRGRTTSTSMADGAHFLFLRRRPLSADTRARGDCVARKLQVSGRPMQI
jgi:hypothetical protein